MSFSTHGAGGGVGGGGGFDDPLTDTPSIVAVVLALVVWLVTARPTYTSVAIGIVSVPTTVQAVPSSDSDAVNRSPFRCRRTQCGGADIEPAVLADWPPAASRRWKAAPFADDTSISACAEPGLSVSRIITPAFDQAFAFCTLATRIWIVASPVIG